LIVPSFISGFRRIVPPGYHPNGHPRLCTLFPDLVLFTNYARYYPEGKEEGRKSKHLHLQRIYLIHQTT